MGVISSRWADAASGDAQTIFALLRKMHAEVGRAPLNPDKALYAIGATVEAGLARMVFDGSDLVGSFGLWRSEWWFGDEKMLMSQWLYVAPSHRAGNVLKLMLGDIRDLVDEEGIAAYVHVYKTRPDGRLAEIAEELGVVPSGRIIAI